MAKNLPERPNTDQVSFGGFRRFYNKVAPTAQQGVVSVGGVAIGQSISIKLFGALHPALFPYFGVIGSLAVIGAFMPTKLRLPQDKKEVLSGWIEESLKALSNGEHIQFTEIEGEEPLLSLDLASDSDFDLENPDSVVIVDVKFHRSQEDEVAEMDLQTLRLQVNEVLHYLLTLDLQTPEFQIKTRIDEEVYEIHEAMAVLELKAREIWLELERRNALPAPQALWRSGTLGELIGRDGGQVRTGPWSGRRLPKDRHSQR